MGVIKLPDQPAWPRSCCLFFDFPRNVLAAFGLERFKYQEEVPSGYSL